MPHQKSSQVKNNNCKLLKISYSPLEYSLIWFTKYKHSARIKIRNCKSNNWFRINWNDPFSDGSAYIRRTSTPASPVQRAVCWPKTSAFQPRPSWRSGTCWSVPDFSRSSRTKSILGNGVWSSSIEAGFEFSWEKRTVHPSTKSFLIVSF